MKKTIAMSAMLATALAIGAAELKNGAEFTMGDVPEELTVRVKRGGSVRFLIEENATTGYQWEATFASNECAVVIEHRGADASKGPCGAPGKAAFTVTKNAAVQSPSLVEFSYRRPWERTEKGARPPKTVRLVLYTIPGEQVDFRYPASRTLNMLKAECRNRGIEIVDWHVHIRGGLTPEMAAEREKACGFRQSAMENHGREWEIFDNARLVAFAEKARAVRVNGHTLPVGIQVNDRDWFRQIDAATRAKFDYILADTMIMGKLPNGRDRRLWLIRDISEIGDPEKWMDEYVAMNLQILGEPISILANPGYLPAPLDAMHDRLWTEERMRKVIGKAVRRGIAIEIQAESPYPSPRFLRLAKSMGAKFSFGTNNYDAAPKDLSRWLEAIVWLDLKADDIWSPANLVPEKEPLGLKAKISKNHRITDEGTWYGFRRTKFDFNGRTAWIVEPDVAPAKGLPWTWTMQWAEAFVDRTGVLDLLRRGFHHVTIDLFDTRMDERGLEAAAAFQKFLVEELGFAPKANLVGMSWGGFFSTRYASFRPENVAKIYLDAPLLGFDGFGNPDYGRIGVWANRHAAETDWATDPEMPINKAERLAAAKIPILLLYGGCDTVVPPAKNCEIFVSRFRAAGGTVTVNKRGLFGHHPHGLDPDKTSQIVDFFLKDPCSRSE